MKVLYFEDNPAFNTFISGKLAKENFEVYPKESLEDTLEWLRQGNKPDLALLDIMESARYDNMTGDLIPENPEAGFMIAEKLMLLENKLPIVFLTGYDNEKDVKEKAAEFGPVAIFGKGSPEVEQLDESITKKLLDKINEVLQTKRDIDPLEQRLGKAFGKKIAVEIKNRSAESTFEIVDLEDIVLVEHKNEPEPDIIELTDDNFKAEVSKLLQKEFRGFLNLFPLKAVDVIQFEQIKWTSSSNPKRKNLDSGIKKYMDNCLLFLKKEHNAYFKFEEGSNWMNNEVNEGLKQIARKYKKERTIEEVAKYNAFLEVMLEKVNTRCQQVDGWVEISKTEFNEICNQSPNPIFQIEDQGHRGRVVDRNIFKTVDKQFLELTLKNEPTLKIYNVSLSSCEKQLEKLRELKQETTDSPYIRLSGNIMINGNFVRSFTESRVVPSNGPEVGIKNTAFNRLRELFPTLKTKVS